MTEKIDKMLHVLQMAKADAEKFVGGNSSAGTRVRKAMQEVKKLAQEVRLGVQDMKNENKEK